MWGLAPACLAFSKLKKMLVRWRSCRRITQRNQLPRRIFCGRQRSTRVRVDDRQHFSAAHSPNRQALTLNGDHSVFFVEDSHSITHVPLDAQFYPATPPPDIQFPPSPTQQYLPISCRTEDGPPLRRLCSQFWRVWSGRSRPLPLMLVLVLMLLFSAPSAAFPRRSLRLKAFALAGHQSDLCV